MIQKLKTFIKTHRKLLLMGTFFLTFLYFTDFTFADGESKPYLEQFDDLINKIVKIFNFASQIVAVLLALLTYLSTMFLSPEWINGSFFGIHTYLKSIWVLVSNLVYFVFAFILIGIAFMNIVGIQNDKFQLKQALPKFIVGILIVPFSWFIVNFILTISAVLTVGALNLPYETFKGYSDTIGQASIPTNCTLDLNASSLESKGKDADAKTDPWFHCDEGDKSYSDVMSSNRSSSGIFGTIGLYTYGILGIENAASFNKIDVETIKNMGDLLVKVVFDALFIIVYAILMIALGLVLMVRGIYIWVYMMLSPIFGLMFFFDKKEGGEGLFSKMNLKDFLSLAMVPVYSMLALSFGMLFLVVVGQGMISTNGNFKSDILLSSGDKGETSLKILTAEGSSEGMSLTIKGSAANKENITNFNEILGKTAEGTLGVIGSLILKIFGIVVLWGAVMAALKTNKITEAVVKPLEQFGSKVGEIAKASPQYLPIFPGGQSMQSMSQTAGLYQGDLQQKSNALAQDFHSKHNIFGGDDYVAEMQKLSTEVNTSLNRASQIPGIVNKAFASMEKDRNRLLSDQFRQLLIDIAKTGKGGKDFSAIMKDKTLEKFNNKSDVLKALNALNKDADVNRGGKIAGVDQANSILWENLINTVEKGKKEDIDNSNDSNSSQTADGATSAVQNNTITMNIDVLSKDNFNKSGNKISGIKPGQESNILNELGITDDQIGTITKKEFETQLVSKLIGKFGTDDIDSDTAESIASKISQTKQGKFKT